jgi:chorismate mutase
VASNTQEAIFQATRRLLIRIVKSNRVRTEEIAGIVLTATPDLNADFPAYAARRLGWTFVPLLCACEIDVPGAMRRLIRALVLVNTHLRQDEVRHQFLGAASKLRPDLAGGAASRFKPAVPPNPRKATR